MENNLEQNISPAASSRGVRRLWPKHLALQLILLFSLMLAVAMSAFSYRMMNEVITNITSTMKMQANVLANNISATGANFLLQRNYAAIEDMLLRAIEFPGVIAIQLCDSHGKLLGDVRRRAGQAAEVYYGEPPLKPPVVATTSMHLGETIMVLWQPIILGDVLGWTVITYSLQDIIDAEQRFWVTNALAGIVIILLALLALRSLMRRPLTAIERYTQFADRLNEMHGEQIRVDKSSIELQKLGRALNSASLRLEQQAVIVKDAMSGLENLASFPEGSPDIVLSLDANATVTYLNPRGQQTLDELELTEVFPLLPADYAEIVNVCLLHDKTVRSVEVVCKQRAFLWTFSPLPSQRLVHGYAQEVTKRKIAEAHARHALVEKQVAEAANQAKSLFLANMSHEIRTPLNGVMGFLNLLAKTRLTSTQQDYLNTTKLSAKMLLTVINDILDFSKIEAGKISIERIDINFRDLLEDIVSLHAPNAQDKGLELILVLHKDIPACLVGDSARITQVITNLLGNAIKFTQRGEIVVQVALQSMTEDSVIVEIIVQDSGIGISAEARERLFKPFSQADTSTTRLYGGTGLGLVIAKTLVELMGGTISVESAPGQGTCFTFTLRMDKQKISWTCTPMGKALAGLRILVASPNTMATLSIVQNLQLLGIDVDTVTSGSAALQALQHATNKQQRYDAIIYDEATNDIPAKELPARCSAQSLQPASHIILLGNIASCLAIRESPAQGLTTCISKPAMGSELYKVLKNIFVVEQQAAVLPQFYTYQLKTTGMGKSLRTLVVDDNEINRKLAVILIEQMGGQADTAADGVKAVDAYMNTMYDVILMDAHMPIMDGIEATRRIREMEKETRHHALIIALTANVMSGDKERYLAAGMDEYLSKPINESEFTNILHKWHLTTAVSIGAEQVSEPVPVSQTENMLPLVDPTLGIELAYGSRDTWRTVLGMLYNDLAEYTANLLAATAAGDREALFKTAHKLAGASSYCGTPALQQHAKHVESVVKNSDVDLVKRAVDALLQQIERLQALKQNGKLPDSNSPIY